MIPRKCNKYLTSHVIIKAALPQRGTVSQLQGVNYTMCVVFWSLDSPNEDQPFRFVLVANRDEYFNRAAIPAHYWQPQSILAGTRAGASIVVHLHVCRSAST